MSFFPYLLQKKNLSKHDGTPLWKFMLNDEDFEKLINELKFVTSYTIDPRDVTLYYAEWWKRNYNGGTPSNEAIFESLRGNIRYNLTHNEFYKIARQGAQMLNIKWITKQNTLYFRTLLLQGGLPLSHISENQGKYQAFLLAVLEEQPETIEDFIFKTHIIDLLPKSSQNDTIYENCLEIVKSILNKDGEYDILLESDESLNEISKTLKKREATLKRKQRLSKPKNYWILRFKKEKVSIKLRIGLADKYDSESLTNILGFEATGKEYQFYLNEQLICVFRKMINGNYKTDWYQQQNLTWEGESKLPYTYVIDDGNKVVVEDFIQTIPSTHEPSLWAKYSDNEWLLIKGNGTSYKQAAILFPTEWYSDQLPEMISINGKDLSWLVFEGEIELESKDQYRKYLSEVNSFDWTIANHKPVWMLKANMPVVQRKPNVIVYDEDNKKLPENKYRIWIKKHNSTDAWDELSRLSYIPTGCIDIKIEKDRLVAYDMFFNIGTLQAKYKNRNIDKADIAFRNIDYFELKLYESDILNIENEGTDFLLNIKTEFSTIPMGINGSVGKKNQKKLYFEMATPFEGMTITGKDGRIISEGDQLSISNLYGLRILSTPNTETILSIKNSLKTDVKITKEVKESSQPIISFKDEIVRLYYLADAMDYRNTVCLELSEGRNKKTYKISGFSHTLDIDHQLQNKVSLFDSFDNLELYAVPLNCSADEIQIIPLLRDEGSYIIPSTETLNQFIIISEKKEGSQLMPRFVNTGDFFLGADKNERIDNYNKELSITNFNDDIWKQVLAYFNICVQYDLPFSTFDQLRAISRSSAVASRAFLFLGFNQSDSLEYIQKTTLEMEKDLGFCFHWIKSEDWRNALTEINEPNNFKYHSQIAELISSYMGENGLQELFKYISGSTIESEPILQRNIIDLRSQLGARVLRELPYNSPKINGNYNIQIDEHQQVRLLLQAPIAVAESISDSQIDYPIWAGDEKREVIRRNIQYSQYLKPDFYNKTILHALNKS